MGLAVKPILNLLLGSAERKGDRCFLYRTKNLSRKVRLCLRHFSIVGKLCELIKRLHMTRQQIFVAFCFLGCANL